MYKVYIDGVFFGYFKSLEKAETEIDRWAKQFGKAWKLEDPSGAVHAQSKEEPANHFSKPIQ